MATEKSVATVKPAKERVKPSTPARPAAPRPANSPWHRSRRYLGEVVAELKKATWPSRSELISQTQVVLGMLVLVGVFITVWDLILGFLFRMIGAALGVRI